jgi:hypothetical protein
MYTQMTSQSPCVTFVTSYIDIYDTPFANKTHEWRFNKFRDIASTGIQLCVYVSPQCEDLLREYAAEYPNIKVMRTTRIDDLWTHQICHDISFSLPANRNDHKDNANYMWLMHSKIEFLNDAIATNPWGSTHFAWIDFNVSHVFKNMGASQDYLRVLGGRHFADRFLVIPGCYPRLEVERVESIMDNIHWRFCGGFFMGDRQSIADFYALYLEHYPSFLREHGKLVWEVNFWAWLEAVHDWRPTWYAADHDDRIIQIPPDVFSRRLLDFAGARGLTYDYPKIEHYEPTSASYMEYKGRHWLNTRYVSYWLTPECGYVYPDGTGVIKNINMLSELDPVTWLPISHKVMDESTAGLAEYPAAGNFMSKGLEDMRIYVLGEEAYFIATSVNYSPCGRNRMVTGRYHVEDATYSDCGVIESIDPNSWCEKNWIPLIPWNRPDALFAYRWSPMEIGHVRYTDPAGQPNRYLEIVLSYQVTAPLFGRVRGSSTFTKTEEGWIGVVHFSEEGSPRHYYHMVVLLDSLTYRPVRYSQVFHFDVVGIEFCIGFTIGAGAGSGDSVDDYVFWISRFDRDPMCIVVPRVSLPMCFDVL